MWRAFNPLSCLLLVAVASKAAPTGDEAGRLSQVIQREASVATESSISEKRSISVVKRGARNINSFQEIPATSFNCAAQESPGIFADQETGCQVFHYCQPGGRVDSFFCPNLTLFNQQYFVCDWEYNVDCSLASKYFSLNKQLFAPSPISLQTRPVQTDLLGAASSAAASHSSSNLHAVEHAVADQKAALHPAAHQGNSDISVNSFGLGGKPSLVVPVQLSAALPAGALGLPTVLNSGADHAALALGGVGPAVTGPLAQPVFHSALDLATGSLLPPSQLSRLGKTLPRDQEGSSPQSYDDDIVSDPEPSASTSYASPSPALSPAVASPLASYASGDPFNDLVADPEPYPGATPQALAAAGLPLPYAPSPQTAALPVAVPSSVVVAELDDAVADPEPYPAAAISDPVAFDSADPEPAPLDNQETPIARYSSATPAQYSEYKASGQYDLAANTIDLTSSSNDFGDSDPEPEPERH